MHIAAAVLLLLAIAASLTLLAAAAHRVVAGRPLVPHQPHRPAPWAALDVLWIVVLQTTLTGAALYLMGGLTPSPAPRPAAEETLATEHEVVQLLRQDRGGRALFVCLLVTVVVAPIAEEFLFRVVLQGWLESLSGRLPPRAARLAPLFRGLGPAVLVAAFFGLLHSRQATAAESADRLLRLLAASGLASTLTVLLAIVWLRWRVGATAADMGFVRSAVGKDVRLGLAAFLTVGPWVYVLQYVLQLLLPASIAVDPISLFVLALVLGYLYHRTGRATPSVVVHMALNGTSLAAAATLLK